MHWRHLQFLFVTLIGLSACATGVATPEQTSTIHKIAIVSALGDQVQIQKFGVLFIGNANSTLTCDFDADRYVVGQIKELIGPRYQVVDVAYDKQNFMPVSTLGSTVSSVLIGAHAGPPTEAVASLKPGEPVDAYLVVTRSSTSLGGLQGDLNRLEGLGVYKVAQYSQVIGVYALYDITLVDAKSGRILVSSHAHISNKGFWQSGIMGDLPVHIRSNSAWREPPDSYPDTANVFGPSDKQRLYTELRDLISGSLKVTLTQMQVASAK